VRILDRERYWAFLKAYVICFTSLVGLYIVIDAFANIDEFTKRATAPVEIFMIMGRYYLVHMTEFYDRLCGVIGMMAAIFTVTWMQRNNELLAMLAAGLSTQRVIRPVIVSAVIVSAIAVANEEWLMPRLADELLKTHSDDGSAPVRVASRYDSYRMMLHGEGADRSSLTVVKFFATIPVRFYGSLYEVEAKQATYIPETAIGTPLRGGWLLRGTRLNQPLPEGEASSGPLVKLADTKGFPRAFGDIEDLGPDTYFLRTTLTFKSLTRRRQWYQYASTSDLIRGLNDPANEGEKMDLSVFLHNRILRPALALVLLLMTLPQVLGGYGGNMFVNLGISLGTAAVFYALNFMAQFLGSHAVLSPEFAAWGPLIGFGTFAALRWDAIRT
jgi:lipopolysaccharide export system permease protein